MDRAPSTTELWARAQRILGEHLGMRYDFRGIADERSFSEMCAAARKETSMHPALDKTLAPLSQLLLDKDNEIEGLRARVRLLMSDLEEMEDKHLEQENEKSALDTLDDFRDEVRRISGNRMLTVDECLEWMKDQAQNVRTGK